MDNAVNNVLADMATENLNLRLSNAYLAEKVEELKKKLGETKEEEILLEEKE